MIRIHSTKHKRSLYNVGDEVVVKNSKARTRRRKKVPGEVEWFEAKVIETRRTLVV